MNQSRPLWLIIFILCVIWVTGCAAQASKAKKAPELATGADAQDQKLSDLDVDSELTAEEDALFDDDLDDMDEDESQAVDEVSDPIEPYNRAIFTFNEKLYDWMLRPAALGYRKVTPRMVRVGIDNFFTNLKMPIRFTNCILQGKGRAASAELSKFMFNSTFGVLGFGDLFKKYPEMNPDPEDMGQTLGTYGVGEGFYIVWPIAGASTLRDSVNLAEDTFLNPLTYDVATEPKLAAYGVERINTLSFRIEDIDAARKAAFDPYQAYRDFYIQSRRSKIKK